MKIWRLLKLDVYDASKNMAIDEAITSARIEDAVPNTLRLYRWKPSAVSIGRFQDVSHEVQVENCREHGVDIVRRISGGGTVYHDSMDEITYSIVVKEKDFGSTDVVAAYNKICDGLIEAAKILGVKANFSPGDPRNCPNIAVNGRKISGSAQYHKGGVLLQHGTFLMHVDLERMFTFLRVPWAKAVDDVVCVAKDKLTSIGQELKRGVNVERASEALIQGFQKALEAELMNGDLTKQEQQLVSKLRKEKYTNEDWNLKGKV
ncbi:MAG TPA: biotin/lipoate A/B protein ligase family protein [Candidatus Bathyarchaeia archaeon]|nr:biotin/lipoate A/B protein ligase family protein [Candidatus Bathyarchaeia archaeon]